MTSSNQSTCAFLGDLLSRYDGISTYNLSPELSTLVSSNAAPTIFQATQLKASIEDLNESITEIQNKVDLLQNAAASLEMKMEWLKDIRRHYRAALSPIHRLPAEVLVEILSWTPKTYMELRNTPDDPQSYYVHGFDVFKISEGPWYLGQVCSSWRHVVRFLCPGIWLRLNIGCPLDPEDITVPAPRKGMVGRLNQVLECGRNHCLDFFFISYRHGMENPEELVEPQEVIQCFDLLLTHSNHWGSVEFEIDPFFIPRLSQVCRRVDRLENVHVMCTPDAMPGTMDAFKLAPKLEVMDLAGMHAEANILFPKENLSFFSDARPISGHNAVQRTIPESPSEYHPQIVHQSLQTLSTPLGPLIDSARSLFFMWTRPLKESDVATKSLFLGMTETARVGDALHHTLVPCLDFLDLTISLVEFDTVDFLDARFVEMVASWHTLLSSRILDMVRIDISGRQFHLPFMDDDDFELNDSEEHSSQESMSSSDSEED
ncbi:hypothetical protein IW262DRAFT_1459474 [Armillaria fumosa]|nr:hypothetical protein IW262DRAFT_1459474 [Armillaria fumosa]